MAQAKPAAAPSGELPPELDDPLFLQAVGQLDQALVHAGVDGAIAERLRYPERALSISIPVRLDDGTLGIYAGYRVQHSSVLGPTAARSIPTLGAQTSRMLSICSTAKPWPLGGSW
jgi:glutamate dehydrogenase/leucine dehydrogenase